MNETSNRQRKAQAIAAALTAVHVTADTAARLDDTAWALAAQTGWYVAHTAGETVPAKPWTGASPATRRQVIDLLDADAQPAHNVHDLFASIAAGVR